MKKKAMRHQFWRYPPLCLALLLALSGCGGGASSPGSASTAAAEYDYSADAAGGDSGGGGGGGGSGGGARYASEQAEPAAEYSLYESYDAEFNAVAGSTSDYSGGSMSVAGPSDSARKIITTVDLYMESIDYDRCVHQLYSAIEMAGGYVEYSDITGSILTREELLAQDELAPVSTLMLQWNGELTPMSARDETAPRTYTGDRRLDMRIRVPQSGLSGFLGRLESMGNVLSKQESAQDITLDYVDIESHKKVLQAEQERLLDMLSRAETVEDMILLEQRLSNVRYQLERYESQLRVYDDLVSYATVNLTLREVLVYTETEPEPEPTVGQRIANGMAKTFSDIGTWWTDLFVWFMTNLVYIVAWAIGLSVATILLRKRYKKLRTRMKAEQEQRAKALAEVGTAADAHASADEGEDVKKTE